MKGNYNQNEDLLGEVLANESLENVCLENDLEEMGIELGDAPSISGTPSSSESLMDELEGNLNDIDDIDDLDELDLFGDSGESKTLPSIRLELDGISTEEELSFIKSKSSKDGVNDVPLYITFGLDTVYVCDVDLNIDLLLNLKFIGLNKYTLTLVHEGKRLEILKPNIDETDVEMLINFVRIGGLR